MAQVAAFRTDTLTDETRDANRHHLWLSAEAEANGDSSRVLIHNLSASGLLIESTLALELGEEFDVDLPEAGATRAQIVWRSDGFYGCQFAGPVSGAAVSAARLRSPSPANAQVLAQPSAVPDNDDTPMPAAGPAPLSPPQKAVIIVGLALACWVPIILAAVYFF